MEGAGEAPSLPLPRARAFVIALVAMFAAVAFLLLYYYGQIFNHYDHLVALAGVFLYWPLRWPGIYTVGAFALDVPDYIFPMYLAAMIAFVAASGLLFGRPHHSAKRRAFALGLILFYIAMEVFFDALLFTVPGREVRDFGLLVRTLTGGLFMVMLTFCATYLPKPQLLPARFPRDKGAMRLFVATGLLAVIVSLVLVITVSELLNVGGILLPVHAPPARSAARPHPVRSDRASPVRPGRAAEPSPAALRVPPVRLDRHARLQRGGVDHGDRGRRRQGGRTLSGTRRDHRRVRRLHGPDPRARPGGDRPPSARDRVRGRPAPRGQIERAQRRARARSARDRPPRRCRHPPLRDARVWGDDAPLRRPHGRRCPGRPPSVSARTAGPESYARSRSRGCITCFVRRTWALAPPRSSTVCSRRSAARTSSSWAGGCPGTEKTPRSRCGSSGSGTGSGSSSVLSLTRTCRRTTTPCADSGSDGAAGF